MHNTYGTGAMAKYRRSHRGHHPSRCKDCGKIDTTGLIDGQCTRCYCKRPQRVER